VSTNPEDPGSKFLKFLLHYMPTLTAQKWGKALVFFAPSLKEVSYYPLRLWLLIINLLFFFYLF